MLIWVKTNPTRWGKWWSALAGGHLNLELLPQAPFCGFGMQMHCFLPQDRVQRTKSHSSTLHSSKGDLSQASPDPLWQGG